MIRPGLLTASTNRADHLGTSGAGLVAYRCMVWCSFRCSGFGIENAFSPFRSGVEARVGAQRRTWKVATKWRTEMEPAEWRLRRWAPVRRWERRKGEK